MQIDLNINTTLVSDLLTRFIHAEITRSDRGYEIRDTGSLNGTYVDHERVEVTPLRDLNEVQIGRFVLTFVLGSGPRVEA